MSFEGSDDYLAEKVGGVLKFKIPNISQKPTYDVTDTDKLLAVEYYNGNTQITANRLVRVDLTYTGDDVTTEETKIYSTADGTTVLRTITKTMTYSDNKPTNTEISEA